MNEKNNNEKGTTVKLEAEPYSLILERQMKIFSETKKRIPIQKLISEAVKRDCLRLNDLENME